jgi:hypothetical protein
MLTCSKCGYDNELGRIFCHSCGAKLDLNEIKAPSRGGAKLKKSGAHGGRLFRRTIGILILLAVLIVLYLAAQVPSVRAISTTNHDLDKSLEKRFDLDQLAIKNQPQVISFTAAELNAFINSLGFEKGKNKTAWMTPSLVQLELGNGIATVVFVGKVSLGSLSKKVYLSYTGRPMVEDGRFEFVPVRGSIGALPISGSLLARTGIFDNCFGKLFSNLTHEKQVLDSLKSITVTSHQVDLNYVPPPGAH